MMHLRIGVNCIRFGMTTVRKGLPSLPPRARSKPGERTSSRSIRTSASPLPASRQTSENSLVSGLRNLSISSRSGSGSKSSSSSRIKPSGIRRNVTSATSRCQSLEDVANFIENKKAKNIVVMAGAGISTPSGIPDFRTPGTGLYDNLQKYRIPYPEAIFDIDYFQYKPKPFFALAKELFPSGKYRPNVIHYFVRLLHERGLLLRMYTQNIDGLERLAGIPAQKLVEAHGTFATATCCNCGRSYKGDEIKNEILQGKMPHCRHKSSCSGVIKPDIVFFGEDLPKRFYNYIRDFPQADLLIIMGTSLEVEPFAGIVDSGRYHVPRLLINMDAVGPFKKRKRFNDVVQEGDLVDSINKFITLLNWESDMNKLLSEREAELDKLAADDKITLDSEGNTSSTGVDSTNPSSAGASKISPGLNRPREMHTLSASSKTGPLPQRPNSLARRGLKTPDSPSLPRITRYRNPAVTQYKSAWLALRNSGMVSSSSSSSSEEDSSDDDDESESSSDDG